MKIITRQEATQQGLSRYYTGKPCKHGHIAERNTKNGQCLACQSEAIKSERYKLWKKKWSADWYKKNKDKRELYTKENAERISAVNSLYYKRNKVLIRAKQKENYEEHKVEIQQMRRYFFRCLPEQEKEIIRQERRQRNNAWRKANVAKDRLHKERWRKKNSHKVVMYTRARQKQVAKATPVWADIGSIEVRYKERVTMSNLTGLLHHVDHIVPLQGDNVCGLHVANNLRVILARDNIRKSNRLEMPRSSTA